MLLWKISAEEAVVRLPAAIACLSLEAVSDTRFILKHALASRRVLKRLIHVQRQIGEGCLQVCLHRGRYKALLTLEIMHKALYYDKHVGGKACLNIVRLMVEGGVDERDSRLLSIFNSSDPCLKVRSVPVRKGLAAVGGVFFSDRPHSKSHCTVR